jgi:hypothetical protein
VIFSKSNLLKGEKDMDIAKEIKEIKEIASFINEDTKNIRLETIKLAKEFEDKFNNPPFPINIDDVDRRYTINNGMYCLTDTWSEEGFKQIAATSAVPVDDTIKTKLVIIEQLYPKISEVYRKYKYVDEVWYLDKQSIAGGNTYKEVLSRVAPGFDIGGEYEKGERPYSRFGIIGPEQNPNKESLWSPNALIEIFDEFVISAQAPVYVNNELAGKISIHYNLVFLREDKIVRSQSNLMLITNQFTLVGMSPGVKKITHFTEYNVKRWDSKKAKMEYIDNELNLVKQNKDFTDKLKALKPGNPYECEFSGKNYQIFKEDISEIGFQVLALL